MKWFTALIDWVGQSSGLFEPLLEALRRHVMATKNCMRMTRAGDATPAVWFGYTPDRKGEHPVENSRLR